MHFHLDDGSRIKICTFETSDHKCCAPDGGLMTVLTPYRASVDISYPVQRGETGLKRSTKTQYLKTTKSEYIIKTTIICIQPINTHDLWLHSLHERLQIYCSQSTEHTWHKPTVYPNHHWIRIHILTIIQWTKHRQVIRAEDGKTDEQCRHHNSFPQALPHD